MKLFGTCSNFSPWLYLRYYSIFALNKSQCLRTDINPLRAVDEIPCDQEIQIPTLTFWLVTEILRIVLVTLSLHMKKHKNLFPTVV